MGFLPIIGGLFGGAGATAAGAGAIGSAVGAAGTSMLAGTTAGAMLGGTAAATVGGIGAAGTAAAATAAAMGGGAIGWTMASMPSILSATPAAVAGAAAAGSFWANAANMASVVGTGASLLQGMQGQDQEMPAELQLPELQQLPEEPDPRKAALEAQAQEREALKRRVSFTKTILTGPRGLLDAAPVGYKTLMGA